MLSEPKIPFPDFHFFLWNNPYLYSFSDANYKWRAIRRWSGKQMCRNLDSQLSELRVCQNLWWEDCQQLCTMPWWKSELNSANCMLQNNSHCVVLVKCIVCYTSLAPIHKKKTCPISISYRHGIPLLGQNKKERETDRQKEKKSKRVHLVITESQTSL